MYFYTLELSFLLFCHDGGRKLHTMTTTGGGTPCDLQQYNNYIFFCVCFKGTHKKKDK